MVVPLLILVVGLSAARGDGDLARRDRDHGARGDDPVRRSGRSRRARATRCSSGFPPRSARSLGTALQQRLTGRALSLAFAAFLAGVALWLLLSAPAERTRRSRRRRRLAIAAALGLGLAAGVLAGLFGVGGGLLFVPTLVWLGLGQLEAEATSLLAILPTVAAGAWRQHRYGNLRHRAALVLGLSSVAAVEVGVLVAKALPEDTLQPLFAVLLLARRRAARVALAVAGRSSRAASMLPRWPSTTRSGFRSSTSRSAAIVAQIQADDPEIERLVGSPRRILAFRTFAYIRVGVKLGELLVEHDVPPYDGSRDLGRARSCATRRTAPPSPARCVRSPRRSRPTRATPRRSSSGPTTMPAPASASSPASSWRTARPSAEWTGRGPSRFMTARKRKKLSEPEAGARRGPHAIRIENLCR